MADLDPLLSELDALGDPQEQPAAAQQEPEVGTSETARQLDNEGYFNQLGERFFQERQQRSNEAIDRSTNDGLIDKLTSGLADPQQYWEGVKGIAPGAVNMGATGLRGLSALNPGEATATVFDRYRADVERVPEMTDAEVAALKQRIARDHGGPKGSVAFVPLIDAIDAMRAGEETRETLAQRYPRATPVQERTFYQAGDVLHSFSRDMIPAAAGYEQSVGRQIGEGLGSMVAGVVASAAGGPALAGLLFSSAGVGEATQRAVEFDKAERTAGRPGLTQEQILTAGLMGVAPGMTDLAPVEIMLGRLKVPGMTPQVAKSLAGAIGQVGGRVFFQAAIEGGQEAFQQILQNVIAWTQYNPNQDLTAEVLGNLGIGAAVGGVAQGGREGLRLVGRRGGRAAQPSQPAETQPPAAEATPAPQTPPVQPETVAPVVPQPDPSLDPFNLERFAPAPETAPQAETEAAPAQAPETETAAPESDLGRIAAMADRPSDTPAAPAVLPPDVLEYLRETNPELAERYDNSDISGAAPDTAAAPPLPTLRERLEALNQGRQDADPALEAAVDANLPAYHADMEDVLARLEIATPLSDTDVRAVARHMARDNLTAEEALERHAVEAYEAERQARAQPETVGVRQAPQQVQAPAAPAGGTGGQPAGAQPGRPGTAELGTAGARPAGTAAPAATGQPQRGTEQAPAAASTRDAAGARPVTEPTPQQRSFLNRILGQKKPLKWSEVQGRLRASPEQMEALRQEALAEGLLRRDRHGVYRRTAKVAAVAAAGMPSLQNPNTLSIPPDVRIDNAIRIREALTGKPVSPLVRSAAIRLLAQLGGPRFTTILSEVKKDGGLKVADVRDLAALVGHPPTARTSKADAFRLISARHLDHKGFLERQARSQQMAAFEPARSLEEREAAARTRMETPEWISAGEKPADPSLYTYNQKGYLSPEWAAERRYVGANGEEIVGVADAVNYLVEQAEALVPGGVAREKKAYLIIGFPGAGKSTIARALSSQYHAAHMVSDIPKAIIPEYDGGKNGEGVHEESSELSKLAINELVDRGDNIILETLGTWPKVAKRAAYFLSRGYQPSLVFVDIPKAVAMERAIERWQRSGRAVPLHTFDLNPQEAYANALDKGAIDEAARVTLSSDEQGWVVGEATGTFGALADAVEEQVQARNARMVRGAGGGLAGRPDRVRRDAGGQDEDGGRIGDPTDDTNEGPGNEGLLAFQGQPRLYTQAFRSQFPQAVSAIQRELERMLPADVPVRMMDRLFVGPAAADERVSIHPNGRMLLEVALSRGLDVARLKGFHGVTHILRERGLWSDKEWNLLVERANKTGMADRLNATRMVYDGRPDTPMLEGYRAFYTQQAQSFGLSEEEVAADVAEKINQEMVAALAESWAEGTSYGTSIDTLLERIAKFFEAIRNALNGLGFQTVDDIFERVASGEVARRAEGGRREPTFDPFPYKPSPEEYHLSTEEGMAAVDLLMGTTSAEAMFALKAFHGSPHDFDRFDISRIGTGEGAQAFGHGLYFAEHEGVARNYRDKLATGRTWARNDPALHVDGSLISRHSGGGFDAITVGRHLQMGKDYPEIINMYERLAVREYSNPALRDQYRRTAEIARQWRDHGANVEWKVPDGRLYEVSLDVEPEQLLDWDKKISEQPQNIKDTIKAALVSMGHEPDFIDRSMASDPRLRTGNFIISESTVVRDRNMVGVSSALHAVGLKGIRYLDQGSRDQGDGTYNYVIFSDADVKIVAKDGKPVSDAERADVIGQTQDERGQEMAAFAPEPKVESRPFSIPGFNGSVEERVKSSGERIRTYAVKPDITGTASESDQSPLQPLQSYIVSEQADGSWELSFFKADRDAPILDAVAAIEADIGNRLSPKGWLTPQSYRYWQSADPQSVRYHQNAGDLFGGMYASPRAVEFGSAVYDRGGGDQSVKSGTPEMSALSRLKSSLPPEAFTSERNEQMFSFSGERSNLDLSPAARKARAEAMGFDTSRVLYHGTMKTFDAFQGRPFGEGSPPVVWLTPLPWFADYFNGTRSDYGSFQDDDGSTLPLYIRPGKQLVVDAKGETPFSIGFGHFEREISENFDAAKKALIGSLPRRTERDLEAIGVLSALKNREDARRWINESEYLGETPERYVEGEDLRNALAYRTVKARAPKGAQDAFWEAEDPTEQLTSHVFQWAKENGYDSIIIKNMIDNAGRQEQIVVFDPSNIRSTNATFDPSQEGSPVLMAAFRGTPKKAKSVTGSLKGTQIEVSPELTAWLGIPHGKFQANYESIAKKRGVNPSPGVDLSDPAAVRDFVEDVLTRAEFAIRSDPNTPNQWDIVVRDSLDRVVGARLRLRGRTYSVGTALVYEPDQLDARLLGAARTWGVEGVKWKDPGAASTVLQLIRAGVGFPSGSGIAPVPVDPSTQEVIDALEQSQGGGQVLPAFSSDDNRTPPYLAPPGQVAQPASPTGGNQGEVRGLADIIADLKETLGLTTTQGRYGLTVVDRAGGRRFRFRAQPNVRGQYDRNAGVARIRIATDIDAIAHEGGHHLERVFAPDLDALKQTHAEELGTPPAPNTPLPQMNPQGYSGLELDADTQGVLVEAATAMRAWRAMAAQRGQARSRGRVFGRNSVDDAAYHEASSKAAMATGVLERRLGKPIAQALIGDILGDARIAPGVIGQSPLRRAVQTQGGTSIQEIAPEDMAAYVTERYSRTGVPQPRNVPAPTALQASEGFAEFFRRYIVDPDTVQRDMPGVYSAFEEFLDAADPAMLENLEKLQLTALSADYKAYRQATAVDRGVADVATMQPETIWEQVKDWYRSDNRRDRLKQWISLLGSNASFQLIDRTNPILKTQQALLRLADANGVRDADGRPISLEAGENAHRIARLMAGADKIGHQFITHGVPDYQGLEPVGPSLHDALVEALGGTGAFRWSDQALRRFGLYLEARRAIAEWPRYQAGEIPSPPTRRSFEENWQIIQDLEKSNPSYKSASQKVYDWQHRLLTLEYQAGKWTKEAYDELSKRKNFYVPFMRDLSDLVPTTGGPPGSQMAKRFVEGKRFQGSQRDVINPVESLVKRAYEAAAAVQFNDMVKALTNLSERAGPGGAGFVERVQKEELLANNARTFERIKDAAITNGIDPADAQLIVQQMEMQFTDATVQLLWDPDNLGPNRPPIVPLWEDGIRKLVRLNDPIMGRRLFDAMNAIGREQTNIWIKAIAYPAAVLRAGVTMHPAFIISNILADMQSAWVLTGATPVLTQVKGVYALASTNPTINRMMHAVGITPPAIAQLYSQVGGISGGQSMAALRALNREYDLGSLRQKGYHVLNVPAMAGLFTTAAGGAIGGVFGGVVGATVGASVGAMTARAMFGVGAERAFVSLTEASETATRLGVASMALKRVKKQYPNISDVDAVREAAFTARDVIDFDRAGAKAGTLLKIIPFLSANIQGVSKAYRQSLLLDGERGRINMQKAGLFLRWQLTGTGGAQMRAELSPREQQAVRDGARAWVNMMILAAIGVSLALLFKDDPEYDDVRSEVRNTHFVFKLWGTWFRVKKPFELAHPANAAEAFYEWMFRNDPRLMDRIAKSFRETHTPPVVPQTYNLITGWRTGVDPRTQRPIVHEGLARLPAPQQYGAYSSAFAIGWAQALEKVGVRISPMVIDWTLNNELAYWGREIRVTSDYYFSNRAPRWTDVPVTGTMLNRFTVDPSRSSASVEEFWKIMGRGRGDFDQAAAGYDNLLRGGNPGAVRAYLAGLSPEERTYAVLQKHFSTADKAAHPLNRANSIYRLNAAMRREMADKGLISTEPGERGTTIDMAPAMRAQVDNVLGRLAAVEAWNALHDVGRPGWAAREVRDPQPVLDELRAASVPAYEEMLRRRQKDKVTDYPDARERWADVNTRIDEMIVDDDLLGLAWDKSFRKRRGAVRRMEENTGPRVPIIPQPGPSPVQVPY